ncbi:hypothetical protein JCM33374_g6029 [Metschnikowia sp. JCM 33374]|nr:hypothetical protein JCM33374_g6029 [Metschnikowia sp. JCM 33374]
MGMGTDPDLDITATIAGVGGPPSHYQQGPPPPQGGYYQQGPLLHKVTTNNNSSFTFNNNLKKAEVDAVALSADAVRHSSVVAVPKTAWKCAVNPAQANEIVFV